MLGIAAMFTSCSQSEDLLNENDSAKQVTFTLTADGQAQTRAAGDQLRYLIAIYDKNGNQVVQNAKAFSTNTFEIKLNPGDYTFLLWADYGNDNYDATNLKEVVLKNEATNPEAFHHKLTYTIDSNNNNNINVTLKRAVAKVVLKSTGHITTDTITVTYSCFNKFNVLNTNPEIMTTSLTKTINIETDITGTDDSPVEIGSIMMLANQTESNLITFKTKYGNEEEKSISNVPIQANYVTNINGMFCDNKTKFSINLEKNWNTNKKNTGVK